MTDSGEFVRLSAKLDAINTQVDALAVEVRQMKTARQEPRFTLGPWHLIAAVGFLILLAVLGWLIA